MLALQAWPSGREALAPLGAAALQDQRPASSTCGRGSHASASVGAHWAIGPLHNSKGKLERMQRAGESGGLVSSYTRLTPVRYSPALCILSNDLSSYEADLSAECAPTEAEAWLPRPHVDEGRPRDPEAPPRQGAQAPLGLRARLAAQAPPLSFARFRCRLPPRPLRVDALSHPVLVRACLTSLVQATVGG